MPDLPSADAPLDFTPSPIAIVGAGAIFPGAPELDTFWRNLVEGRDQMREVPPTHWLIEDYFDANPKAPGKVYAKRGAFLDPVEFDPMEFGLPPTALPSTDTAQLIPLIVAKKLAHDTRSLRFEKIDRRRISVMLGLSSATELIGQMAGKIQRPFWVQALREEGVAEDRIGPICDRIFSQYPDWNEATFPGLLANVAAGRLANRFDLGGTNCTVDAACASSLAAIAMGVHELQLGHSDLVITGGVDTLNDIFMYMCFTKTPALSPSGDCRPFSAKADGTMLGEGVGLVALRRLADAERDGDRIYAVIRGVGSSSDGRAKSVYAPRPEGQSLAVRRALDRAGFVARDIELIEGHGTGTVAGDAAEFAGLVRAFADDPSTAGQKQWCALGSIKSQIGHTKSAAGAAGLMKVAFALHQRVLPPTIKIDAPNPKLDVANSPFVLNTQARPWIRPAGQTRKAGLSSFGFGGSNFHLVLEEYAGARAGERDRLRHWPREVVPFSAPTPAALAAQVEAFAGEPAGRVFAASVRARQLAFEAGAALRLVVLGATRDEIASRARGALERIRAKPDAPFAVAREVHFGCGPVAGLVAFVFPGQGSQYVGMGGALAMEFDEAREVYDRAAALDATVCPPLHPLLFPNPVFTAAEHAAQQAELTRTENVQPALGLTALAQLGLLRGLGLEPAAVAGHSYGELVALHAAGVLPDEAALLQLSRARGECLAAAAAAQPGGMSAVAADSAQVAGVLGEEHPGVTLANHNSPRQTVIAGSADALAAAEKALAAASFSFVRLPVAAAFHSPLVGAAVEPFTRALAAATLHAPRLPVYANVTAAPHTAKAASIRKRLAEQLASPVRWVEQVRAMHAAGIRIFVEVGAGNVLTRLTGDILAGEPHLAVALDDRKQPGMLAFADALAALAAAGVPLRWAALWANAAAPAPDAPPRSPATVTLTGANVGKPYPPANGAAGRAAPNLPSPVSSSSSRMSSPSSSPSRVAPAAAVPPVHHNGNGHAHLSVPAPAVARPDPWLEAFQSLQASALSAHQSYQQALATSHQAYLRAVEVALQQLGGASGSPVPAPVPYVPAASAPLPVVPPVPAPVVVPVPVVSSPAPSVAAAPAIDHQQLLYATVAEATGYPVEMLKPEMELEAGLGIDSIKRVEIFSALQGRLPHLAKFDTGTLATLSTLGAIVDFLRQNEAPGASTLAPLPTEPVAPAAAAAPAVVNHQQFLFETVAEATGYPVEMLKPEMELEAGLGIDSIKRVEIFSALQGRLPHLAKFDTGTLAALSTLGAIVEFLRANDSAAPAAVAAPPPPPSAPPDEAGALTRLVVQSTEREAPGFTMPELRDAAPAYLIPDTHGVAAALAVLLNEAGIAAHVTTEVPRAARVVIFLRGLDAVDSVESAVALNHAAFAVARSLAAGVAQARGAFVIVQDTGGDFSANGEARRAWSGGLAALAKTAATEWPQVQVKAVDLACSQRSPEERARALFAELLTGGADVEVGLSVEGRRRVIVSVAEPLAAASRALPEEAVFVVSGGARGVTVACLRALARRGRRLRFALLGRTPLAAEPAWAAGAISEADLKRACLLDAQKHGQALTPVAITGLVQPILAAREARANIASLEAAGAAVRYFAADIGDSAAVTAALAEVRAAWGPVYGLVHAAGVLADKRIAEKTDEQFSRVFGPKIEGLRNLLTATQEDLLGCIALFSSVAARAGNPGQCDYAMANAILNQVAHAEMRRRGPACVVKAFGWGPWDGGMVHAGLKKQFAARGVGLIPLEAGAEFFARELMGASPAVELVVGQDLAGWTAPAGEPAGQGFDIPVAREWQPWLEGHRVHGTVVVPVVLVVEWFIRALAVAAPGLAPGMVKNLKVLRGVRVLDFERAGLRLRLELSSLGPDGWKAVLQGADGLPHYQAELVATGGTPTLAAPSWSAETLPAWTRDPGSIYEALFHRGAFQVIRSLDGTGEQAAETTLMTTTDGLMRPLLLDGGLQTAVLWNHDECGRESLPTGFGRLQLGRPPRAGEPCRCRAQLRRNDANHNIWDIVWLGEDGAVIALLEAVSIHKLAARAVGAAAEPAGVAS